MPSGVTPHRSMRPFGVPAAALTSRESSPVTQFAMAFGGAGAAWTAPAVTAASK
jgi:hypothetical protein